MAASPADTHQVFTEWLRRNDWVMHTDASTAVEEVEALSEGVPEITRSQLRAILNTARVCDKPRTFKRFLDSRRRRRDKEAQNSGKPYLKKKAAFWNEVLNRFRHAQKTYVNAAASDLSGVSLSNGDKMRVIETYFEHLIAHCKLHSRK